MARYTFLIVTLVAYIAKFLYDRASVLGAFRSAGTFHTTSEVRTIPDTINAEDLHYDAASGLIFTAAQGVDNTRPLWFPPLHRFADPKAAAGGGLRVIDPKTFTAKRLTLEGFSGPFATHGIDIFRDSKDSVYIQAVNHAPNPAYASSLDQSIEDKAHSRVEIFHHVIGSDVATHVMSVSHPLITTPNDIYATGPTSFYVTNDHHYREGPLRFLEDLGNKLVAGWTDTIHVEAVRGRSGVVGVTAKVALSGMHNNNGLGHGPDGQVIVCDASGGYSFFADIKPDDTLELVDEVQFKTTIDNPFWFTDPYPHVKHDASGLVNSGLTQAFKIADELDGKPIASSIWLARGGVRKGWNTTLLWEDDGTTLSSASASVLIAIDPRENKGKKQAWLFASGFASRGVVATVVDL